MDMKKLNFPVSFAVLLIAAAVSGLAYYRHQASVYEDRWTEALDQLTAALKTPRVNRHPETPLPEAPEPIHETRWAPDPEIETLRAELAEKEAELERLRAAQSRPQFPSAEERKKQMEELKQTDPEKYEELISRREAFRDRIENAFAQRAALLIDRDTNEMNEKELAHYEQMLNALERSWQLTEKMTDPETSPEERRELRQEMQETSRELRPLLSEERTRRLEELGTASGYSENEAEAFADYIQSVYQATSLPGGGMRGPTRGRQSR